VAKIAGFVFLLAALAGILTLALQEWRIYKADLIADAKKEATAEAAQALENANAAKNSAEASAKAAKEESELLRTELSQQQARLRDAVTALENEKKLNGSSGTTMSDAVKACEDSAKAKLDQAQTEIERLKNKTCEAATGRNEPAPQGELPVRCAENGKLVTIGVGDPLPTCTRGHIINMRKLTDSAYITINGDNDQNIRLGKSGNYDAGCKVTLHQVAEDRSSAKIVVVCQ
jgi:hypothetical protein